MPDPNKLVEQTLQGSVQAMSRLIRLVENREAGWMEAMKKIHPHTGKARMIGITGPPGAGKSTLTNCVIKELSSRDNRVGVIAIDPSSPFSGGSLLGDRLRMKDLWKLENVFIRSMATRGELGGLNQSARDVAKIMDAFGNDFILIETVGVGQGEIEVIKTTDLVVLVCVPGQGDSIQALKAGIMEIADIFVINKADTKGVEELEIDIREMLDLSQQKAESGPPILKTIANRAKGISELISAITRILSERSVRAERKSSRIRQELMALVEKQLVSIIADRWEKNDDLDRIVEEIRAGRNDPYSAAEKLLAPLLSDLDKNRRKT